MMSTAWSGLPVWQHYKVCNECTLCALIANTQIFIHRNGGLPEPLTQYPTQSCYSDTEQASPCLFPLMPSARLGSDRYQFGKPLLWFRDLPPGEPANIDADSAIVFSWKVACFCQTFGQTSRWGFCVMYLRRV